MPDDWGDDERVRRVYRLERSARLIPAIAELLDEKLFMGCDGIEDEDIRAEAEANRAWIMKGIDTFAASMRERYEHQRCEVNETRDPKDHI